eukprot:jgi/Picre1/33638/NNA_001118.t1
MNSVSIAQKNFRGSVAVAPQQKSARFPARRTVARRVQASAQVSDEGFELMRKGVKVAAEETILTPRFYTTDFDEMADLFDLDKNPNLRMDELEAMLNEFRRDYNQTHFVRNDTFKAAADKISGPTRKIFIEFLERSCTAEFSGFLLYKELGRRLKDSNPVVAEIFTLLSRDEARHAGFINKALSDFNLALDLGFLTKNRTYTFFKPKFIVYATYLSEKIGYWRYISIYRHLQRNPDNQLYPMFEYFENWCQDESRHGDFLAAVLKARPELLNDFQARMWSRFFCLSVYITMYLNDHQRTAFYESLVPDVEHPEFFNILDKMVECNQKIVDIGKSNAPDFVKTLQKLPAILGIATGCLSLFFGPTKRVGSADIEEEMAVQY